MLFYVLKSSPVCIGLSACDGLAFLFLTLWEASFQTMSDNESFHGTPVQGDAQIGKIGYNLRGHRDLVIDTHS